MALLSPYTQPQQPTGFQPYNLQLLHDAIIKNTLLKLEDEKKKSAIGIPKVDYLPSIPQDVPEARQLVDEQQARLSKLAGDFKIGALSEDEFRTKVEEEKKNWERNPDVNRITNFKIAHDAKDASMNTILRNQNEWQDATYTRLDWNLYDKELNMRGGSRDLGYLSPSDAGSYTYIGDDGKQKMSSVIPLIPNRQKYIYEPLFNNIRASGYTTTREGLPTERERIFTRTTGVEGVDEDRVLDLISAKVSSVLSVNDNNRKGYQL